jgi:hypothetical protein
LLSLLFGAVPYSQLTTDIWYNYRGNWFYCETTIYPIDAVTGLPIVGDVFVRGNHSISPDVDDWTDYYLEFPYEVSGWFAGTGLTDTEWIPTYRRVSNWIGWDTAMPANYAGTQCTFRLTELKHPDYDWEVTVLYPGVVTSDAYY